MIDSITKAHDIEANVSYSLNPSWELVRRPDVPVEVAIDEYVEIAKSFFEGPEPGFVNAALDGIARDARG